MKKVVDKFLREFEEQLLEKKVSLTVSPEARKWLAVRGYDVRYGARPLARVIQEEIKDVLSEEILFGRLESGGKVTVDCEQNCLKFSYEHPAG